MWGHVAGKDLLDFLTCSQYGNSGLNEIFKASVTLPHITTTRLCGKPCDVAQVLVAGKVIAILRCLQPSAPVATLLKVTLLLVNPQMVTD